MCLVAKRQLGMQQSFWPPLYTQITISCTNHILKCYQKTLKDIQIPHCLLTSLYSSVYTAHICQVGRRTFSSMAAGNSDTDGNLRKSKGLSQDPKKKKKKIRSVEGPGRNLGKLFKAANHRPIFCHLFPHSLNPPCVTGTVRSKGVQK